MGPFESFLQRAWESRFEFYGNRSPDGLQELFSLDAFDTLIGARNTGLSLVSGGIARPYSKTVVDVRQIYSVVYDAYANGSSVLQTEIQENWPPLASLCRKMTEEYLACGLALAQPVTANAYLTPARSQAFKLHYDNHCAIILQIHGTKDWKLFDPELKLPVDRCLSPIDPGSLKAPCFEGTLTAGDILYIPRGFPHVAEATDQSSLHITLSLKTQTWAEMMHTLFLKNAELRRSFRSSAEAGEDYLYFKQFIYPVIMDMDVNKHLEEIRYRRSLSPSGSGRPGFNEIDRLGSLATDSVVIRDAEVSCKHKVRDGKLWLFYGEKTMSFNLDLKPAIAYVCEHARFSAEDLPAIADPSEALQLIRMLMIKGVVIAADNKEMSVLY
jgi:hypothetical protein